MGITNYEIVEKSKAASDDVLSFWKSNTKTWSTLVLLAVGPKRVQVTLSKILIKIKWIGCLSTKETDFTKFHKRPNSGLWFAIIRHFRSKKNRWVPTFFFDVQKKEILCYFQISRQETSFIEDIQVILKCPKMLFIKAILTWRQNPKITIKL
jgi:lycopene beta-cyclase